jgi:hypothetical protein
MIPTNKFEPKQLRNKGTSRALKSNALKSNEKTRKRHENPTSHKWEIDATIKASIHSEVRFFTKRGKI